MLPVVLSLDAIEKACVNHARRGSKEEEAAAVGGADQGRGGDDAQSFVDPDYQELRQVRREVAAAAAAGNQR